MQCAPDPELSFHVTVLTILLVLFGAVVVLTLRELVKRADKTDSFSIHNVLGRKDVLIEWLERIEKDFDPDRDALYISTVDAPLFDLLRKEGRFSAVGGRWHGFKVRLAELDEIKGEPCTRLERLDYHGYRNAIPWTGRFGPGIAC